MRADVARLAADLERQRTQLGPVQDRDHPARPRGADLRARELPGGASTHRGRPPSPTLKSQNVELGASAGDYTEILAGIEPGQRVVTSAQFLLDSESNLGAVMKSMMQMGGGPAHSA